MLVQLRGTVGSTISGADMSSAYTSLASIGVSTGASTGTVSGAADDGYLTINTSELDSAVQNDPTAVQQLLTSFSTSFQSLVNDYSSPTGAIETRIEGNSNTISNLQTQISSQEQLDTEEQQSLVAEWTNVETTLSNMNSQQAYLSSFSDYLDGGSSSSSSSS